MGVLLGGVLTSYLSWPWTSSTPPWGGAAPATPRILRSPRRARRPPPFTSPAPSRPPVRSCCSSTACACDRPRLRQRSGAGAVCHGGGACRGVPRGRAARHAAAPPAADVPDPHVRGRHGITTIVASIAFSEFFLLTLYLQQVIHYSAVQTGLAFAAVAVTIAVVSNSGTGARHPVRRRGACSTAGLCSSLSPLALIARLPVAGPVRRRPARPVRAERIGLALCFIPMTIAGLHRRDAGGRGRRLRACSTRAVRWAARSASRW